MKISNLKVGQIIKNYNDLCNILEIKNMGGNVKLNNLDELERFVKYHKEKYKYIIDEIYEIPKPKIDNIIYSKYVDKLILDLLAQKYNKDKVNSLCISKSNLLKDLEMINNNYIFGLYNKSKSAKLLDIDIEYIKEFYNLSYSKLKNTLESALKRLELKSLITWHNTISIIIEDIKLGRKMIIADDETEILITHMESIVLEELGCPDRRIVAIRGKWDEFTNKVNYLIRSKKYHNIDKFKDYKKFDKNIYLYYYRSYTINYNIFIMKELKKVNKYLLENDDRLKTKNNLNYNLVINYKKDNQLRYDKSYEEYEEWGTIPKNNKIRIEEDYVKNSDLLVDTCIKSDAKILE